MDRGARRTWLGEEALGEEELGVEERLQIADAGIEVLAEQCAAARAEWLSGWRNGACRWNLGRHPD